ncbi:MAG: QueT transporter family protein [Defluviitaleaceae bacterium]|nr:QueT transporter family protein [Defluviitaleaceae bacterium]
MRISKMSLRGLIFAALVAAIYTAITVAQSAIGFGPIQFRVAESLNLLAFFNPIFVPAVALGVFLSNLIGSPYGILDAAFGTIATVIALVLIRITKRVLNSLLVASVWPTLVNAIVIPVVILLSMGGFEALTWAAFWPFAGSVFIGQFVVVNIFGYILFKALSYNKGFMRIMENL